MFDRNSFNCGIHLLNSKRIVSAPAAIFSEMNFPTLCKGTVKGEIKGPNLLGAIYFLNLNYKSL